MELRLDRLLEGLRHNTADLLAAIDRDPLLLKKEIGGLVLANAGHELYTPAHEHQLYAKGVVYRRDPYRLVSLPLVKIYNLGERNVTASDLVRLAQETRARLRFLRKLDGSMVQFFRADGRGWFTTRGLIEGARSGAAADTPKAGFDFLGAARRLAERRYPRLLDGAVTEGRTLVFELIHPGARNVTDYGEREELVLLGCFDRSRFAYLGHDALAEVGRELGLAVVDALAPRGASLTDQIDDLMASLAGTDQEGCVLNLERDGEVVYRVKIKTPEYLRLMRALSACTYEATVALIDADPRRRAWPELEADLKSQGREPVPEELLGFYRRYHERFLAYLADCERARAWGERVKAEILAELGETEPRALRKAFAARAGKYRLSGLLFAALDGRLDVGRVRQVLRDPEEARVALGDPG